MSVCGRSSPEDDAFRTGAPIELVGDESIRSADLSDSGILVVLDFSGRITLIDLSMPGERRELASDSTAWYIAIDPSGRWVAEGGPKISSRIWDLKLNEVAATCVRGRRPASSPSIPKVRTSSPRT